MVHEGGDGMYEMWTGCIATLMFEHYKHYPLIIYPSLKKDATGVSYYDSVDDFYWLRFQVASYVSYKAKLREEKGNLWETFTVACLYTYMPIDMAIDLRENIHDTVNNNKICECFSLKSIALYGI